MLDFPLGIKTNHIGGAESRRKPERLFDTISFDGFSPFGSQTDGEVNDCRVEYQGRGELGKPSDELPVSVDSSRTS